MITEVLPAKIRGRGIPPQRIAFPGSPSGRLSIQYCPGDRGTGFFGGLHAKPGNFEPAHAARRHSFQGFWFAGRRLKMESSDGGMRPVVIRVGAALRRPPKTFRCIQGRAPHRRPYIWDTTYLAVPNSNAAGFLRTPSSSGHNRSGSGGFAREDTGSGNPAAKNCVPGSPPGKLSNKHCPGDRGTGFLAACRVVWATGCQTCARPSGADRPLLPRAASFSSGERE